MVIIIIKFVDTLHNNNLRKVSHFILCLIHYIPKIIELCHGQLHSANYPHFYLPIHLYIFFPHFIWTQCIFTDQYIFVRRFVFFICFFIKQAFNYRLLIYSGLARLLASLFVTSPSKGNILGYFTAGKYRWPIARLLLTRAR